MESHESSSGFSGHTAAHVEEIKRALGSYADSLIQHVVERYPDYTLEQVTNIAYSLIPVDEKLTFTQKELAAQACELFLRSTAIANPPKETR